MGIRRGSYDYALRLCGKELTWGIEQEAFWDRMLIPSVPQGIRANVMNASEVPAQLMDCLDVSPPHATNAQNRGFHMCML